MWFELGAWLSPARVENITIALGSAIIGTFGGAFAGAWAAQRISKKAAEREAAETEMRNINAAIELAYVVANRCINCKEQQLIELKKNYDEQYASAHDCYARLRLGTLPPGAQVHLGKYEFNSLDTVRAPIDRLQRAVLERIGARGRMSVLAITLGQSLQGLEKTIQENNQLMVEFRDKVLPRPELVARLFAIPSDGGDVDHRFEQTVFNLVRQCDECVFFSYLLCVDLQEYGRDFWERHPHIFKGIVRGVGRVDFGKALAKGLIPSRSEFADWSDGFQRRLRPTNDRRMWRLWWRTRYKWRRWHRSLGWRPQGEGKWRKY